jgi:hypothetical protein
MAAAPKPRLPYIPTASCGAFWLFPIDYPQPSARLLIKDPATIAAFYTFILIDWHTLAPCSSASLLLSQGERLFTTAKLKVKSRILKNIFAHKSVSISASEEGAV